METFYLNDNSQRDIEIVKSVLESGHSIELPAMGYSMFPGMRPGDVILVRALGKDEVPEKGSVIICVKEGATVRRPPDRTNYEGLFLSMNSVVRAGYEGAEEEKNGETVRRPPDRTNYEGLFLSMNSVVRAGFDGAEEEKNGAHHLRHHLHYVSVVKEGFGGRRAQRLYGTKADTNNNAGVLVMHRLVDIIDKDSDKPLFITRGDSRMEPDEPWEREQLLGVAVSFKRGRKEYPVRTNIPDRWKYSFNNRLLWIYWKINKVKKMVRG